jgi:tetratricopeptide (TPR) repeat protein
MIKSILFFLLLFLTLPLYSQTTYENSVFGFKMEKPESWKYYGSTEFDERKNECNYIFFIPLQSERISEWDNSLSITARGNGYANSLADVHLFERQRLHRKFDDLIVIEETNSSLLTQATINDVQYNILTLVNYQNGIGYLSSFSFRSNQKDVDTASVSSFFNRITYSPPEANYDDIDAEIKESTENATLYFKKAQRKFNFHEAESGMEDVNKALDMFPFYGEAYYLRGYLHLALGDTVEACRDFHSSISEDYAGESELIDYCNTRRISEALEEDGEEPNLFEGFDPNADHIEFIDSIKEHKYIVLSVRGEPNPEVITYMNQLNHIFMLDYKQLDSLYKAETGILQLYAFGIMCRKFPEQINNDHKKILKNKNGILVLNRDQKEPHSVPIKEIASMMFSSIEAMEEEKKMKSRTESEVSKLIRNYAKHPESYEPISFEQFDVMHIADGETLKKEKDSEDYVIGHRYRLKDVNGNTFECYNTFKFDHEFQINIIEGEESNTVSAYPPMVQEWLDKYGRTLSNKDKKKLRLQ